MFLLITLNETFKVFHICLKFQYKFSAAFQNFRQMISRNDRFIVLVESLQKAWTISCRITRCLTINVNNFGLYHNEFWLHICKISWVIARYMFYKVSSSCLKAGNSKYKSAANPIMIFCKTQPCQWFIPALLLMFIYVTQ